MSGDWENAAKRRYFWTPKLFAQMTLSAIACNFLYFTAFTDSQARAFELDKISEKLVRDGINLTIKVYIDS